MLDYFNTKKNRKPAGSGASSSSARRSHQEQRDEELPPKQPPRPTGPVEGVPVLDRDEQSFLENLTLNWDASDDGLGGDLYDAEGDGDGQRPPLPPRIKTPDLTWDSDSESFVKGDRLKAVDNDVLMPSDGKKKEAGGAGGGGAGGGGGGGIGRRLSTLFSSRKAKDSSSKPHPAHLVVPGTVDVDADAASSNSQLAVSKSEEERERDDLARVLDDLDFGKADDPKADDPQSKDKGKGKGKQQSKANKFAVSLSAESTELVRRFVTVLKDLVNGVPTAADDLKSLLDDRDGTLARGFERLPSSLRKLVSQLPSKLTSSLAPELLAAAAASQGIKYEEAKSGGGFKMGAKTLLPLLTKPNAIVKMLKAIMNALKLRWPAFIGTSAIWSVALFLLLFVLWYCHKRGREVRLEKEASDVATPDGVNAAGGADAGEPPIVIKKVSPEEESQLSAAALTSAMPRPPIGPDALK
ncbi:hypothetical protein SCUCBS95973_006884 [Sporothrix curviconia]|uniref:Ring-like domain-containing protein n=1 Tax=Sporothrix curviconia TaxID=1260050 RepID=A0ABP0C9G3_9PEZI